jgi:hypothetical protein
VRVVRNWPYFPVEAHGLQSYYNQFPSELRDEIVARYPRKNFKESFLQVYFGGFAHKPGTTCGTVNAGICERFIPGYQSPNAVDWISASPFPDSESQS